MVNITKDMVLPHDPIYSVADESGEYDDHALIVVYLTEDPLKLPYAKFEAIYIAYGNEAYQ